MSRISYRATSQGLAQANEALKHIGSKAVLANRLLISRSTVSKFFGQDPINQENFEAICKALQLDWQGVAGIAVTTATPESPTEHNVTKPDQGASLETLVQQVRRRIEPDLRRRCGTMRVLDMVQPIELGSIYTDVNILQKLTRYRRLGLLELLESCGKLEELGELGEFDRFSLAPVEEERVPGLEAVQRFSQLMVLGKPGAGKTTFLKFLAMQCLSGDFLPDRVPLFVTLKDFAETKGQPDLLTYLHQYLNHWGIEAAETFVNLLDQGRCLVLLDGLDEVREQDNQRVVRQMREFGQRYPDNTLVITCRIAAREYTFEQFTEVEVADFDPDQVSNFAHKWFTVQDDAVKGDLFMTKLQDNKPILELASNPLLLTLLCLVFGEGGDFPRNRSELYKEGLDVLLKKWDAKRNIERDQAYQKLSLHRKENLLSQIAYDTFSQGDYFFKRGRVEGLIQGFIVNLPDFSPEDLQVDRGQVLESI
jgi:predicted NACHT family NTPase